MVSGRFLNVIWLVSVLVGSVSALFLVGCWMGSGWFLDGFWVVSGWFLVRFWLVSGWFLVAFWLMSGWFLGGLWLVSGWFLVGVWLICLNAFPNKGFNAFPYTMVKRISLYGVKRTCAGLNAFRYTF